MYFFGTIVLVSLLKTSALSSTNIFEMPWLLKQTY